MATTSRSPPPHQRLEIEMVELELRDAANINGGPARRDEEAPPQSSSPGAATRLSKLRHAVLVVSMFMALFLPALDQNIVSTALPTILRSLGADSEASNTGYTWVGAAYALAQAVVLPFFGQASEVFGRKSTFLAAIAVFMLGSCLCGAARDVAMLIASRTVQGAGAGGITGLVIILIGDLVGTRKRGKYQGFMGATWAVASALGPVLSGVLAQSASWRWCFFLNLPICFVCLVVNLLFLNITPPTRSFMAGVRSLDMFGILSIASATILLLLGFEWASQGTAWDSPQVLLCLIVSALALVTFVLAEMRASNPVIPLGFFTHPTRIGAYAAAFFHAMGYMGLNYYLPVYFQAVKGQGTAQSGISMLPLVLMFGIVSTGAGYIITMTKRYQELIWASFVLGTVGCGLLILLDKSTSTAVTVVLLLVAGIGVAPNFNSLLIPIHASFDNKAANSNIALSASAYSFIRTIGLSMGISVGGLVLQRGASSEQQQHVSVSQLIEELADMPAGARRSATVALFESAMRRVFIAVAVVMGVAMLASVLIRRHELGEQVRSDHKFGGGGEATARSSEGGSSVGGMRAEEGACSDKRSATSSV